MTVTHKIENTNVYYVRRSLGGILTAILGCVTLASYPSSFLHRKVVGLGSEKQDLRTKEVSA